MRRSLLLAVALVGCDSTGGGDAGDATLPDGGDAGALVAEDVTILRDEYAVPHVYATSARGAAYALGWIDGEDLGAGALQLAYYGSGAATRRFGDGCAACPGADALSVAYHLPDAVASDYERIAPDARAWIEAYAEGLSAYFAASSSPPAGFDPTDPPGGRDIAAAMLYLRAAHATSETTRAAQEAGGGSNQLAISGARTSGELTVVLKDPHNAWQTSQRYAHVSIDGFELFGNFGLGTMGCGSNRGLAFGCTRAGPNPGIRIEAAVRRTDDHPAEGRCAAAPRFEAFDHAASGYVPLTMRCLDLGSRGVWIYESRFGPVSAVGDDADMDGIPDTLVMTHLFAVRDVAGVDYRVHLGLAADADAFEGLFAGPTPPEDAQYRSFGDRAHHLGGILGATTPVLDASINWAALLSSADPSIDSWTTSEDWSDLGAARWHNLDGVPPELPHVRDPQGDFFENCNGDPRFGTVPEGQIGDVPSYLERWTTPTVRDQRMVALVRERTDLDLDALSLVATDVEVPFANDLVDAARCGIAAEAVDPIATYGDGGSLFAILAAWRDDGSLATPDAEGATIMALLETLFPTIVYPGPGACFSRGQLDTFLGTLLRDGLAAQMRGIYTGRFADPLAVPWSHVNYTVVAGREVGLPGMAIGRLTTLMPVSLTPATGTGRGSPDGHGGSALLQLTAYSDAGWQIRVMPPLGQIASDVHASSPHLGQTIDAYVARTPREVWLDRADVEAHLCPFAGPGHEHADRVTLTLP
ncbi:MAG: penicillin acylase family protein [Sandaracinaceae bacterium]